MRLLRRYPLVDEGNNGKISDHPYGAETWFASYCMRTSQERTRDEDIREEL